MRDSTQCMWPICNCVTDLRRQQHDQLLVANLPSVVKDLERGAIVSLSPTRLAVRDLPVL